MPYLLMDGGWHQLTNFQSNKKGVADGYTGPAMTTDGRTLVWSEIVDGNVMKYTFGKWNLIAANWEERNSVPRLTNAGTSRRRDELE